MRGKGQQCGERLGTRRPWKPLGSKLGLQVSQKLTRASKLVQRVTDGHVLSGTGQQGPSRQEDLCGQSREGGNNVWHPGGHNGGKGAG